MASAGAGSPESVRRVEPPQTEQHERRHDVHANPTVEDECSDQGRVAVVEAVPVDEGRDQHERREEGRAEDPRGRRVEPIREESAQEEVGAGAIAGAQEDRRELRLDRPSPRVRRAIRHTPEDHERGHEDGEHDQARPVRRGEDPPVLHWLSVGGAPWTRHL